MLIGYSDHRLSLQGNARLLVVEDNTDILTILKRALKIAGYGVEAFSDPLKALEHFKLDPAAYHLLLTDTRMPNMSGFELARQLKDANPATRVLFITAIEVAEEEFEREVLPLLPASHGRTSSVKNQAAIIIQKPARLDRILAAVKEAMSDYSSLTSPSDYEHIVFLYSGDDASSSSTYIDVVAEYINGGLAKNQLCIYTYVEKDAETAMAELSKRIANCEENMKNGNLLLVDFKPYCTSAMNADLRPFEDLMRMTREKTTNRADKHVRIVGRAAGWLYENKHFDQCLALERWWHSKPFNGSLLCPYKMSLFEHKQFFEHTDSLFVRHDTILKI